MPIHSAIPAVDPPRDKILSDANQESVRENENRSSDQFPAARANLHLVLFQTLFSSTNIPCHFTQSWREVPTPSPVYSSKNVFQRELELFI
jgi:hypothetical protein